MSGVRACRAAALAGLLLAAFTARGLSPGSTTYAYDGVGRIIAVIYEDGTGQIYNYDPAGNRRTSYSGTPAVLSITPTASVTEGGTVTLTVTRSNNAVATAVNYQTANGSAIAGTNYTSASGTLNFSASQSTQTLQVTTLNDNKYDGPLSFNVKLTPANTNAAISNSSSVVTINEASSAPSFSIASGGATSEGNAALFTVTRSGATSLTQSVSYATADGIAKAGVDYTSSQGSLSFAPSTTSLPVNVPTTYETKYEGTRSFTTALSNPGGGAVIGTASATATINDTNTPISFAVVSPGNVTEGSPITFTVNENSGPPGITFSINYATANGTAVAGTDYTAASGTLSFPVGTTSLPVTVSTADAHQDSTLRNFTITLSNASNGAPIGTATATGGIQAVPQPLTPTLSPGYQYTTTGSFGITWNVPGGNPTSYKVYQSSDNNPTPTVVYTGTATQFSKTISGGANNGIQFYYQVQACNANGCSASSNTATVGICLNGSCSN